MTIIGFIGKPRTGKTLLAVFSAYADFCNGAEIYANLTLKNPFRYTQMNPYDMLRIPFSTMDREKKTLIIQEADKWFNARRSMRNENVLLGSLTGQTGKRNLNIYWDSQFPHLVDNQLRDVTEVIFQTELPYIDSKTKEPLAFQYIYIDDYGEKRLTPIPATLMKQYYYMYDSYFPTEPLTVSKTMKELDAMYKPQNATKTEIKKGRLIKRY